MSSLGSEKYYASPKTSTVFNERRHSVWTLDIMEREIQPLLLNRVMVVGVY